MPHKQLSTDHSKANRPVNDMEVLKETDLNFLGPTATRIVLCWPSGLLGANRALAFERH